MHFSTPTVPTRTISVNGDRLWKSHPLFPASNRSPWTWPRWCQKSLFVHKPTDELSCYPSIESITLFGNTGEDYELELANLHIWLRPFTGLRKLRLLRGCVDDIFINWGDVDNPQSNWNEVLLPLKVTLEILELEGHGRMHVADGSDICRRFGPTAMLSCLPELKKLTYLKAPLHMLRDDSPEVHIPRTWDGPGVWELIKTGLPSSLKAMDVLVVEDRFWEDDNIDTLKITKSRSVRIDL